jgi:DNA-binding NtrC family response regulator/tetratricopeptide (TPR) repeat protein
MLIEERINQLKEQIKNEKSPREKAGLLVDLSDFYLRYNYNLKEAKLHASQALAIAENNKEPRIKAMSLNNLATIHRQEGKIEEALEFAVKALKISEIINDEHIKASVHSNIGLCLEQKGEIDEAIGRYEKSIAIYLEIGAERGLSTTYNNLGNAYWDKGDLEKALEYHQKSLAIKEKLRDNIATTPDSNEFDLREISHMISVSQNNLGLLYEDMGDLEKAIECFYRSLVEKEKCNDRIGIPSCYNNIGEIYMKRGRLEKAIQLFEQAVKTAEDVNVIPKKAEACGNLGNTYFLSGDHIRAMNYYIEDMNLSLKIDDKFELSEVYWRMGELLLATKKEEPQAFDFLQKSVNLSSEIGAKKNEATAHRILGKYYAQHNDLANAKSAFERGIKLLEGMGKCYELGKIYFDYGCLLAETGIRDAALRFLREASVIFRKLEIISESEAVERFLFKLEVEKDRRVALIKSLSTLTSHLLPAVELGPKSLTLLREALVFDAGTFFIFETKPFVLGNITKEEAMAVCKRGEMEITQHSVNLPLRLAGRELGVIHLDWKNPPPLSFDPALFETISNILSLALEHTRARIGLKPELPKAVVEKPVYHFEGIIGKSPKMLEVFDTVAKVAPTKACVLILGESGTGKELIAKTIHNQSPRAKKPFVTINCAAIPETLLESELFGVEKGTATGVSERRGKFEQANGGSIFLDEIGDMSLSLQAKLLRVLQEKNFERLGGRKTIEVDVRIIAATNKNLEQAISQGTFREDLFYRLNVINVHLPQLRERKDDISILANHFVQKFNEELVRTIKGISPEAMELLLLHSWPGNVRELENTIERAVILTKQEYVTPTDLPPALQNENIDKSPENKSLIGAKDTLEKDFILQLLVRFNWNVSRAVKASGISRSQFYRLLTKYQIRRIEPD